MRMRRGTAVILAALMMAMGAMPVLAEERPAVDRPVSTDRPVREAVVPTATGTDQVAEPEVVRPSDRASDVEIGREIDRPVDRMRCVDFVNDRRCIDDRHPHVNLRHLIQRLIHAGEWGKLFRLLHRLGII
jgi:hypothetical protein